VSKTCQIIKRNNFDNYKSKKRDEEEKDIIAGCSAVDSSIGGSVVVQPLLV